MTKPQRMSILLTRWPAACKAQGWDPKRRDLRLQVISDAVGRKIASMNDLDNSADIDKVYAHLGQLSDNVALAAEASQDEVGARRRLLWQINKHSHPLGGAPYVLAIARDKFHITAGLSTIEDLQTSQLRQLLVTIVARKTKRARTVAAPQQRAAVEPLDLSNNPF